jgi:hypothetical protein
VFEAHGIGVVHRAHDLDVGIVLVKALDGVASDEDHDFASVAVGSPEIVVVLAADGEGQALAEEVDGAGFAVVGAVDARLGFVLGGE